MPAQGTSNIKIHAFYLYGAGQFPHTFPQGGTVGEFYPRGIQRLGDLQACYCDLSLLLGVFR